ncbi:MAG: septum formation protein Maf [Bacteroidetes bacterium]|nr:MAG: septum formation protein Maf [Bacteroidota bacterium]
MTKKILLASKSPRRQELIKGIELPYEVKVFDVDETFPQHLKAEEIPLFLAQKKSAGYTSNLQENEILITADTIVWVNNHVLNKPENEQEAFNMLSEICGTSHLVYTGVCLRSQEKQVTFFDCSEVFIKQLSEDEIWHYIKHYKPFDKAGSYGIQDWFGYIAVEKINGCFYNVMGLPVSKLYHTLKEFN